MNHVPMVPLLLTGDVVRGGDGEIRMEDPGVPWLTRLTCCPQVEESSRHNVSEYENLMSCGTGVDNELRNMRRNGDGLILLRVTSWVVLHSAPAVVHSLTVKCAASSWARMRYPTGKTTTSDSSALILPFPVSWSDCWGYWVCGRG